MSGEVSTLVGHLFRHEAGRLVSRLVRRLGGRLELAEDAVQYAMVQGAAHVAVFRRAGAAGRLARARGAQQGARRAARRSPAVVASRELAAEAIGADRPRRWPASWTTTAWP